MDFLKLGVVIPTLSNHKQAIEALESVKTSRDWEPIIIPQWRRNLPLSAAWNKGIRYALWDRECDLALVINDDILFAPYTIDTLIDYWFNGKSDDVVLLTACNDQGYVDSNFGSPEGIFEMPVKGEPGFAEHPDFSCFMVSRTLPERVGWFDENFIPAYFEDNDMHTRINLSGNKAGSISSASYYHYGSQSEKPEFFHRQFETNRNYYVRKWGRTASQ